MNKGRYKESTEIIEVQKVSTFFFPHFSHFAKENTIREVPLTCPILEVPSRDGVMIARFSVCERPSEIIRKCQPPRSLPCWSGPRIMQLSSSLATKVSLYHCWGYLSMHTLETALHCLLSFSFSLPPINCHHVLRWKSHPFLSYCSTC